MSTIASLALAIRARTEKLKGDLTPALAEIKRWGAAAIAAGGDAKEVGREMARMRQEALKGGQQMADGVNTLRDRLQAAKQGAAALSGAVSAASSEMGGAVGQATRLGTSMASAFLAGGPIALGVTALAAGISAIAGASSRAREEAEKAREAHSRWMEEAKRKTGEVVERVNELRDRLRALSLGNPGLADFFRDERKRAEEYGKTLDQVKEQEVALTRAIADRARTLALPGGGSLRRKDLGTHELGLRHDALTLEIKNLEEKIAEGRGKLREMEKEDTLLRKEEKLEKAKARISRVVREINEGMEASVRVSGELLKVSNELVASAERRRNAWSQGLAQQVNAGMGIANKLHADEVAKKRAADEAEVKRLDEVSRDSFLELGKRLTAKAKEHKAATALTDELKRQLQHLKAGSDFARERLQIQERLSEHLKTMKNHEEGILAAKRLAAQEMADVTKREAEAKKAASEELKKQTEELRKQSELVKKKSDITKRFQRVGNSIFGFGAGQVGTGAGDFSADSDRAFRGAGGIPGKGKGSGGGGAHAGPLPELAPHVKAMADEIASIRPWAQRLEEALVSAGSSVKKTVTMLGEATERGVGQLRRDLSALEAKVEAQARAIERAGNRSGVGD